MFGSIRVKEIHDLAMILSDSPSRPNDPGNLLEIRRLMTLAKNFSADPNYVPAPPVKTASPLKIPSQREDPNFDFPKFLRQQRKLTGRVDPEMELLAIEAIRRQNLSFFEALKERWKDLGKSDVATSLNDFQWRDGYRPKDFTRFLPPAFTSRVPKGGLMEVLMLEDKMSPQDIKQGYRLDSRTGQFVTLNATYERKLLELSAKYSETPEVLQVRAFDKEGRVIGQGPIVVGDVGEVGEDAYYHAANDLSWTGNVFLIEIAHTHPSYEYNYHFVTGSKLMTGTRRSEISDGDMEMLYRESLHFNVPVRVKAVLPNGYSYNMTMSRGRIIDDPLK